MEFQDPDILLSEKVSKVEDDPDLLDIIIGAYEMFGQSVIEDLLKELSLSPKLSFHEKYRILDCLYTNSEDRKSVE